MGEVLAHYWHVGCTKVAKLIDIISLSDFQNCIGPKPARI